MFEILNVFMRRAWKDYAENKKDHSNETLKGS